MGLNLNARLVSDVETVAEVVDKAGFEHDQIMEHTNGCLRITRFRLCPCLLGHPAILKALSFMYVKIRTDFKRKKYVI